MNGEELEGLFRSLARRRSGGGPTGWFERDACEGIVRLLQQNPALCFEYIISESNRYQPYRYTNMVTPLIAMLTEDFSVDDIETVVNLSIEQLRSTHHGQCRQCSDGELCRFSTFVVYNQNVIPPLHHALDIAADNDVVEVLARSYPKSLMEYDQHGRLPIHVLLFSQGGPFKIQKIFNLFVELNPECIGRLTNSSEGENYSCLQIAVWRRYPHDLVRQIVDISLNSASRGRTPAKHHEVATKAGKELVLKEISKDVRLWRGERVGFEGDAFMVRGIEISISKSIVSLCLEVSRWESVAFIYMIKVIERNKTITKLSFHLISELFRSSTNTRAAFRHLLERNKILEKVHLFGEVRSTDFELFRENSLEDDDTIILQTVKGAMGTKCTIHSLEIEHMRFSTVSLIPGLLRKGPTAVKIASCSFSSLSSPRMDLSSTSVAWGEECSLRDLSITNVNFADSSGFMQLLYQLTSLTRLESLSLEDCGGIEDITDPLLELVARNRNLRALGIRGLKVAMEPMCMVLREHKHLQAFHFHSTKNDVHCKIKCYLMKVLVEFCTSLEEVYVDLPSEDEYWCCNLINAIAYWTSLNKWGRARIRDPGTPRLVLIGLLISLLKAPESDFRIRKRFVGVGPSKFALMYGLLRESPSLWASVDQATK